MKNIAVKTSGVNKGFGQGESRTEVLKEVNFEARMGELLMLVGPSGCGKTTLLSAIAGTLTVDRGAVEVFDSPLHAMDKKAVTQFRAANIGFIGSSSTGGGTRGGSGMVRTALAARKGRASRPGVTRDALQPRTRRSAMLRAPKDAGARSPAAMPSARPSSSCRAGRSRRSPA